MAVRNQKNIGITGKVCVIAAKTFEGRKKSSKKIEWNAEFESLTRLNVQN